MPLGWIIWRYTNNGRSGEPDEAFVEEGNEQAGYQGRSLHRKGEDNRDGEYSTVSARKRSMQDLKDELAELKDEERQLLEQREYDKLRRQVEDKKKVVLQMRGETVQSLNCNAGKPRGISSLGLENVTLNDLRNDKSLKSEAKAEMASAGLDFLNDSSDNDSWIGSGSDIGLLSGSKRSKSRKNKSKKKKDSGFDMNLKGSKSKSSVDAVSLTVSKKKKNSRMVSSSGSEFDSSTDDDLAKKKKKSGILSKSSDHVKNTQFYPQAFLRFEHVSSKVTFDDLDFNLFVAGELEIISSSSTHSAEKKARLELLKRLMYLSESYDFGKIKKLYAAVLREIELGYKSWGDEFHSMETSILSAKEVKKGPFNAYLNRNAAEIVKPRAVDANVEEKAWFCSLYQRNKSMHKSAHTIVVKGKRRWAQHICASCYLKDKAKLEHPECSSACPYSGPKP